jgi:hypothetical protein
MDPAQRGNRASEGQGHQSQAATQLATQEVDKTEKSSKEVALTSATQDFLSGMIKEDQQAYLSEREPAFSDGLHHESPRVSWVTAKTHISAARSHRQTKSSSRLSNLSLALSWRTAWSSAPGRSLSNRDSFHSANSDVREYAIIGDYNETCAVSTSDSY